MGSLFRPVITTYVLPSGQHRTPDGKRVTKATPGAVPVKRRAKVYRAKYRDAAGVERRVKLCADKTASRQMLAKLETDAALAQRGLADPARQQHQSKPLAEHLEDYRRHLLAKNNCAKHVRITVARIKALLDGCGFVHPADVSASAVAEYLHGLREDPARPALPPGQEWFTPAELAEALGGERPEKLGRILRREKLPAKGNGKARQYPRATVEALQQLLLRGMGITTSNGYLTAAKGFTRWLGKRTGSDPLAGMARLNPRVDVRRERRALDAGELRAVLSAALASPVAYGTLAGADRFHLYLTAMCTGLRAGELASLSPGSFDLAAEPPTVTVPAAYSKNRRTSVQPLPPDVAEALGAYLAGRPAGAKMWPGPWWETAAEMFRRDLTAAGVEFRDDAGRVADFHSLRHSFITLLQRGGVHPKLAQELARHSDIRLTMGVYTHARLHDLAGAVDGLPLLTGPDQADRQALRATGTEGSGPRAVYRAVDQAGDSAGYRLRLTASHAESVCENDTGLKPLSVQGLEASGKTLKPCEGEAGELGFEPRQADPESAVLPLHHSPFFSPCYRCNPQK